MHVYSMFNFCVGTFVGVLGVVFLAVSLFALLKTKKLGAYQDKKQLFVSIYFALYGSHLVSRALDPPHQESQRIDIIG